MNIVTIIQIVGLIITVAIYVFIINWLNKMNSCKCSTTYSEKKYLYEWFIFMIIWLIIYNIILISNDNVVIMPITVLNAIFGLINIVMVIRLFIYLKKLRETKCDCGTLRELNTIYYYLIIVFFVLVFFIIISIIVGIYSGITVASALTPATKTRASSNKNKSLK